MDKGKRGMDKDEKEDEQRGLTAVDNLGALVDGEQQEKEGEKGEDGEGEQGEEGYEQR